MLTHYPWLWGGSEMPAAQMTIYITEPWESHFLPHPRAPEAWKILALSLEILWLQEGPEGILVPSPSTPRSSAPPLGSSLSSLGTYIYLASSTQKPSLCRQGTGRSPGEDMAGIEGAGEESGGMGGHRSELGSAIPLHGSVL